MSSASTSNTTQNGLHCSKCARMQRETLSDTVGPPIPPMALRRIANSYSKVMGKVESSPDAYKYSEHYLPWHAHITALTVAPEARRQGIGKILVEQLEAAADAHNAWFMDLFVRSSNSKAIAFYKELGYSVFRVVKDYYGEHATDPDKDSEDAFDMRKSMKRDAKHEHVRDDGEKHEVHPEDVW